MTNFEDRARCPKCGEAGLPSLAQVHRDGAKTYSSVCLNERCVWFEKNWLFDVNRDGSIPEPRAHRKVYPAIPDRTEEVQQGIDRLLRQSRKEPGA